MCQRYAVFPAGHQNCLLEGVSTQSHVSGELPVGINVVVGELYVVDDESEAARGGVDGVDGARVRVEPEMEIDIGIWIL